MIALLDGMPLVSLPDGRTCLFDKHWITSSIATAAERAGHHRWSLAGHIAESVALYLHKDFESSRVELPELSEAVSKVLTTLGFDDVADTFVLPDPPVVLSLTDLARKAGEGYELAFFGLLGESLRSAAGSNAARLEIRDLPGCLRLMGRRRGEIRGLRREIVGFIRQYGESAGGERGGEPLEIQLS
jgi:hypothetical protein